MKKLLLAFTALMSVSAPMGAYANDQIQIVGSSTVYPFVTVVAEEFGNDTDFTTPIVESTGTGGGFKLFCASADGSSPDLSNASRPIKQSETDQCAENGVTDVTEVKIGFDGIILANAKTAEHYTLTKDQIFRALAKQIPVDGKLADNPNTKWSDVDSSLPAVEIEVYGPPTTSGTRDAFVELVMEPACESLPEFESAFPDKKERASACHLLREDGHYIEAGENDNLIVQKLNSNPKALGIFGYSFLEENTDTIQGSTVDGQLPTFDNISSGTYGVSRSLYVYAKNAHIGKTPGLLEFLKELVSDDAAGEVGYLAEKGLIPLPAEELKMMQERVSALSK